jgi:alpha-mannosidase
MVQMSVEKKNRGTCYFLGNSHLDAAWLWTFSESIEVFHNTCETLLKLMDKHPDFYFCQSSAQYYKWLEDKYPVTWEKVRKRVEEGRWEIVGGTWVEPDGNLPSGESLVRQFLYGKQYFERKFGIDVKIAWMPDSFGFAWSLPQIMRKSGIEFFLTQKMNWNDTTDFPYHFFKWVAPDGSAVLAHQCVGSYQESVDTSEIYSQMSRLESRNHLSDLLILFGIGDHGGGVTEAMITRAADFVQGKKNVKGVFSTARGYFDAVLTKTSAESFPEIADELYLQWHRGTYTNQGRVKKNNRRAECLLEIAEKLSVLATGYGHAYPREELKEAWEILMLNQFHDVLPGSSLPEVYVDSEEYFRFIFNSVGSIVSKSLRRIASKIDTSAEGISIVVFNLLSWPRNDLVGVPLKGLGNVFEVYDDQGQIVPSQVLEEEGIVIFVAENVPSIGYRVYKAKQTRHTGKNQPTVLSCMESEEEIKLENEFLVVKIHKKTGLLTSLFDKKNKMEVLRGQGNVIQVFDDTPVKGRAAINFPADAIEFDAWEVYIHQQSGGPKYVELREPLEVRLVENGPVRATVRIRYKYTQEDRPDSEFDQEIVLCHAVPLVKFNLHVNWHTSHRLAKVAFPLNVHSDSTTCEIPYGHITCRDYTSPKATPEDKAKYEVPGQKWVDHTDADGKYGVSLLNDCKYGFDVADDVIRMTLLRSAKYGAEIRAIFGLTYDKDTATMTGDQGEHDMSYALLPHRSDFREALTARRAYEFNYPLMHIVEANHSGILPPVNSFFSIEPDNMILSVIKKSEDSDDLILRCYETSGKETNAVIRVPQSVHGVRETDLVEREISELKTRNGMIELPVGKHEIKTVKITMRSAQQSTQAYQKPIEA